MSYATFTAKTKLAIGRLKANKWALVTLAFGAALVVFGVQGFWHSRPTTSSDSTIDFSTVLTSSTDTPDETPPDCASYTVPADEPRQIIMPTIDSSGCIQKVGLDQSNNTMAVPSNIHTAGWYVDLAKPGDAGLSIIDGHVGGWHQSGIFKKIMELKKGDQFTIEFGDHTTKKFEVYGVDSYDVSEVDKKMLEQNPNISNQLTLITCGGRYNTSQHTYDKRVLVVARLIE